MSVLEQLFIYLFISYQALQSMHNKDIISYGLNPGTKNTWALKLDLSWYRVVKARVISLYNELARAVSSLLGIDTVCAILYPFLK